MCKYLYVMTKCMMCLSSYCFLSVIINCSIVMTGARYLLSFCVYCIDLLVACNDL